MGVTRCQWPPLLQAFFNQATYNWWRKCHDDILAIVKKPFFKNFFWIKVLMRSSTPLPLVIHAAFYSKIFLKMSSENWSNLEAILSACPSHYSHCLSEKCHIKLKHGVEVDMTIWWIPSLRHSVTPRLKNPGYAPASVKSTGIFSEQSPVITNKVHPCSFSPSAEGKSRTHA